MNGRLARLVVLGVAFAARIATAQPPAAPLRLTLEDAIARGLDTSHRIAEAVARGDAAGATAGQRHAALMPQLAAQAGYTRANHVETFGVLLPNNQPTKHIFAGATRIATKTDPMNSQTPSAPSRSRLMPGLPVPGRHRCGRATRPSGSGRWPA